MKRFALVALLLAPAAAASEYFVDAVAGSNATGDGSSANPWQTVSFALAQVSGTGHTIRVASGTYDPALGEVFPILMEPGVDVIGAGFATTVLDAQGAPVSAVRFDPLDFSAPTRLEGFRVTNAAGPGVRVQATDASGILVKRCSMIANVSALRVDASVAGAGARVEENVIVFNLTGVDVVGGAGGTTASLRSARNWILNSSTTGIRLVAAGGGAASAVFEADRIESNLGAGIDALASDGALSVVVRNSLLVNGYADAVLANATGIGTCSAAVDQSTIAQNAGTGVVVFGSAGATVGNSIVRSNAGGSLTNVPGASVTGSDIEGGGYAGSNGNIDADPLFANAAAGDFQILPGSPCVDAGAAGTVTADAFGDSRPLDGDLDGVSLPDMGCDERAHAHLALPGNPTPGGIVSFEMTGTAGLFVGNWFAFSAGEIPVAYWGTAFLAPPVFFLPGVVGFLPVTVNVPIPPDPTLSGTTIRLQPLAWTLAGGNLRGSLGNLAILSIL